MASSDTNTMETVDQEMKPVEEKKTAKESVSSPHKTWSEIKQAVKENRKQQGYYASRIPSNFTVATVETRSRGIITRIYFTAMPHMNIREQSVHYVDILPDADPTGTDRMLDWNMVLHYFHHHEPYQYNKEEQLIRERKRMGTNGITSYDINPVTGTLVFPCYGSLFYTRFYVHMVQSVTAMDIRGRAYGTVVNPTICPQVSDNIAFVVRNRLWVTNTQVAGEIPLSTNIYDFKTNPVSAGSPSFVMQEEFDRYTGFWWQPKRDENDPVFRILYEEVDETDVEIFHIISSTDDKTSSDEYRYPKPGSPNAKSTLKLVEFQMKPYGAEFEFYGVVRKSLVTPIKTLFPWVEYLVRVDWTPCGKFIWAQMLDRSQERIEIVLIPIESFVPDKEESTSNQSNDVEMAETIVEAPSMKYQVIYQQTSRKSHWINVTDIMYFVPQTSDDEISFFWGSEDTGFRHLYKITSCIAGLNKKTAGTANTEEEILSCQCANVKEKIQLTSGNWNVARYPIRVQEEKKLIFFIGFKDNHLESHLYIVPYDSPANQIVRLTREGFSHSCFVSKECDWFISVFSGLSHPYSVALFKINYTPEGGVEPVCYGYILKRTDPGEDYRPPETLQFKSKEGLQMYAQIYKPYNFEAGKIYPTIHFVYGGPEVQMVTHTFKALRYLRLHTLAKMGYVVVVLDGRGSAHRGVEWESYIKNRMGTVEIEDQVDGLMQVASLVDYIDLDRVAIHGWSYGGYMALMGIAQRSDIYKLSISGAPVVSWNCYDTGYTERYMDTPQNNKEGYTQGSVLHYVDQFPDETNRLLIIHGLIDENVHFYHTSQLINALSRAGKPYQLQVYPNERHGIRHSESSEHYETNVLSFLQQNL